MQHGQGQGNSGVGNNGAPVAGARLWAQQQDADTQTIREQLETAAKEAQLGNTIANIRRSNDPNFQHQQALVKNWQAGLYSHAYRGTQSIVNRDEAYGQAYGDSDIYKSLEEKDGHRGCSASWDNNSAYDNSFSVGQNLLARFYNDSNYTDQTATVIKVEAKGMTDSGIDKRAAKERRQMFLGALRITAAKGFPPPNIHVKKPGEQAKSAHEYLREHKGTYMGDAAALLAVKSARDVYDLNKIQVAGNRYFEPTPGNGPVRLGGNATNANAYAKTVSEYYSEVFDQIATNGASNNYKDTSSWMRLHSRDLTSDSQRELVKAMPPEHIAALYLDRGLGQANVPHAANRDALIACHEKRDRGGLGNTVHKARLSIGPNGNIQAHHRQLGHMPYFKNLLSGNRANYAKECDKAERLAETATHMRDNMVTLAVAAMADNCPAAQKTTCIQEIRNIANWFETQGISRQGEDNALMRMMTPAINRYTTDEGMQNALKGFIKTTTAQQNPQGSMTVEAGANGEHGARENDDNGMELTQSSGESNHL